MSIFQSTDHVSAAYLQALLDALRRADMLDDLVLGGSSALLVVDPGVPPMTRDVDFLVDEGWLGRHEEHVTRSLRGVGIEQIPGTATFRDPGGRSFDLVGYSMEDPRDRLGGGRELRVAVFSELGRILADEKAVLPMQGGGACLSPAGFCAAKLSTLRLDKGAKDRLHALLVLGTRGHEPSFCTDLARLLASLGDALWREDVLADARQALLVLQRDPLLASPDAAPYSAFLDRILSGLAALAAILEQVDADV